MKRRNFIKNAILATCALSVPLVGKSGCALTSQPAAAYFKKSIMWSTLSVEGSVLDKCKAAKEAGFQGIEPLSHMDRKEVIDAMKSTGLEASSVCSTSPGGRPLSSPDANVRQEAFESLVVALEDAKAYGTDAVLVVPGRVNEETGYDECWSRTTESIKKLIPVAEKLKVYICLENVWNYFLLSPLEACRYVDQFNSPYVKFYFDCGNILAFGWPEQWIRILGERNGRIHIKEYSRKKADTEGRATGFRVPLTEGDVDWVKVMDATRQNYKNSWLVTEIGCKTLEELKDLSSRFDKILSM